MNTRNLHPNRKQVLISLVLGLFVLTTLSPVVRPGVASASSSSLLPANLLSGSVTSWTLVGTNNPQYSIALGETAQLPTTLPTTIDVNAWLTYNGQVYWSSSYTISILGGQTKGSTTVNAPYLGPGDYVFYAKLSLYHLITVQSIVDPRIDPDW